MSNKYLRLARKVGGLSSKAKAVLLTLADYADDHGRSFPSQLHICGLTSLSESSVRRGLVELTEAGIITREHRQRGDGSRTSDLITICDHAAEARALDRIRKLPLVAMMDGGRAGPRPVHETVHKPVHDAVDYANPTGQPDRKANRSA